MRDVACKLDLPPSCRIHHVFHISQLKPARGSSFVSTSIPPQLSTTLELMVEPKALLGIQKSRPSLQTVDEVLSRGQGLLLTDATWENIHIIDAHFPHFTLRTR